MKSSVTVSPHAPSVGASSMLPKLTPRPIAVAVAIALGDAPGGASFATGGYLSMSGTLWEVGAVLRALPAHAPKTSAVEAIRAARTDPKLIVRRTETRSRTRVVPRHASRP